LTTRDMLQTQSRMGIASVLDRCTLAEMRARSSADDRMLMYHIWAGSLRTRGSSWHRNEAEPTELKRTRIVVEPKASLARAPYRLEGDPSHRCDERLDVLGRVVERKGRSHRALKPKAS
jgi:hypothetical protein